VLALRQRTDLPADEMRLVGIALAGPCLRRDGRYVWSVDRFQITLFVPRENVIDEEDADDVAGLVDKAVFWPGRSLAAKSALTGSDNGMVHA